MFKKSLSILLILSIIMICPLTAFAMTATSSDAMRIPVSTSSNAVPFMDDYMESDDFDTLDVPLYMSSGDEFSIIPTADARNSSTGEFIRSCNGIYKGTSSGYNFFRFPTLPSGQAYNVVYYYLPKEYFPKPGTYGVTFKFAIGDIGFTSNYAKVYIRSGGQNISESSNDARATLNRDGNIFSCTGNVKIDYSTTKVGFGILISERLQNVDIGIPVSNPYTFTFKQQSGETAIPPSSDTGNGGVSDAIADNTAQQVEQGDTIIELIKNTIQTISSQLTAFWNQLAGEFTNLYNKMSSQHSEQLQADRDNTDDIIASEESNTTNIINNNNANTDKLANGYDSSKLNESGNSLNNKLQEYESAESGINDTASGWLNDFTMPDFDNLVNTGGILSACIWLGSFWQTIFTDMGSFNIPVTLSFTLIFVLMLIGYHRFRR